ncbi:YIP1 family protein [Paenibacillus thermotolerans]|uniref:YIP1 family protein n=1 Tax=Paenibacillus thermotolerans TaxID=3027807 RepID=UPI00236817D6|nr:MULTISPECIES: YIP1 family protein [unclassified Paenibacillus]
MPHGLIKCSVTSLLAAMLLIAISAAAGVVRAETPYPNYYISPDNYYLKIPAPYVPDGYISLDNDEAGGFKKPQDLFVDRNDALYVADTENKRVVKLDEDGNVLLIVGAGGEQDGPAALTSPTGVFVDEEGGIYVTDSLKQRIVQYDAEGRFVREIGKPASPLLGDQFKYQPVKVIVDSRKYFYVVNSGDHKGLLMLDREGGFRGYFGGNRVEATWFDSLIRFLYDQKQRAGTYVNLPYSFNNVALAPDGYIYATTTGAASKQIRKFNMVGGDIYPDAGRNFADQSLSWKTDKTQNFIDATIDEQGNMTVLDQTFGRMYQYDVDGRALFAFGSNGQGVGNTLSGVAIEADSRGNLYVLDEMLNIVLKFRKTQFSSLVHEANELYSEGKYRESFEPWRQVRDYNNFYELALQAMGQIEMRRDDYADALGYFREAYDKGGYSDAFYEYRRQYVKERFDMIASSAVAVLIVVYVFFKYRRKIGGRWRGRIRKSRMMKSVLRALDVIRYAYRVMMHPFLGYEELRYEDKGKWSHAAALMALFVLAFTSDYWLVSFLYEPVPPQFVNWEQVILQPLLIWIIWSVTSFGIATITDGEGRWRDVFIATAYNFTPFIFFSIPINLLTHILTFKEQHFIQLFETVLLLWSVFLFYVSVKETHNYETGKAIGIMGVTAVSCVIFVLLFMLVFGLGMNFVDFVRAIAREAAYVGY